ncbi:MAG: SPASM domain-containing protein [Desulfurococcus sp.]|nr:SPASM domain-containing protein [Desulfurococcus sp.]
MEFTHNEFLFKLSSSSRPREAMVEVTRRCNFSCIYCFRNELPMEYLASDMSRGTYELFLEDAVKTGIVKLAFTGWGEPLIHPFITDFIEMAKKHGLEILLQTNGALLGEYSWELVELDLDELYVSIDVGVGMRIGGAIELILEGVDLVNDAKRKLGRDKPVIRFQFTLNKYNVRGLKQLLNMAAAHGVREVIVSDTIPSNPAVASASCFNSSECISIIEEYKTYIINTAFTEYTLLRLPNLELKTERHCPFMENNAFYLTVEGDVAPCLFYAHKWHPIIGGVEREITPVRYGNIHEKSIMDIWRSQDYTRFRFNVKYHQLPSCLDCPLVEGCALTRSNEADCWGNKPTCSFCPYARGISFCPL